MASHQGKGAVFIEKVFSSAGGLLFSSEFRRLQTTEHRRPHRRSLILPPFNAGTSSGHINPKVRANQVAPGYSKSTALGAETIDTFILLYTVFSATDLKRNACDSHIPVLAPFPIGSTIFMFHSASCLPSLSSPRLRSNSLLHYGESSHNEGAPVRRREIRCGITDAVGDFISTPLFHLGFPTKVFYPNNGITCK